MCTDYSVPISCYFMTGQFKFNFITLAVNVDIIYRYTSPYVIMYVTLLRYQTNQNKCQPYKQILRYTRNIIALFAGKSKNMFSRANDMAIV